MRTRVKAPLLKSDILKAAKPGEVWAKELRALQRSMVARPKPHMTIEHILAEEREDRL